MEAIGANFISYIEISGLFAPVLFVCFHLLRPFFFIPVVFICIAGGVLFGPVFGSIYSLIGITLSSILFYLIYCKLPQAFHRILHVKERVLGEKKELTRSQITVLRLIPFIHFHLLSLCIIEISSGFRDYTKASFFSNIPLAFVYTSIGGSLSSLSPISAGIILLLILPFLYFLRRKEIVIKWEDFFTFSNSTKAQLPVR